MGRIFRIAALAIVMTTNSSRAEIIDGYTPARNDRFTAGTFPGGIPPTPNPTFFLGGFDFSGVGWVPGAGPGTQVVTMISPQDYVGAFHFPLGLGQTVAFRAKDGSYQMRTVMAQTQIAGSDVMVGKLNAPLPTGATGVASYPIGFGPHSAFDNRYVFMADQFNRFGRQVTDSNNIFAFPGGGGLNPTNSFATDDDTDPNGNADAHGFAPGTPTDEAYVQVGDSGAPSFLLFGGGISLLGHHMAQVTFGNGTRGNLDSFLPDYIPQLQAALAADGYVLGLTPVPEPSSLILGGIGCTVFMIRWRRRRKASAQVE
jgi:PEP-CTERM motif